jgi:hypothetical protein
MRLKGGNNWCSNNTKMPIVFREAKEQPRIKECMYLLGCLHLARLESPFWPAESVCNCEVSVLARCPYLWAFYNPKPVLPRWSQGEVYVHFIICITNICHKPNHPGRMCYTDQYLRTDTTTCWSQCKWSKLPPISIQIKGIIFLLSCRTILARYRSGPKFGG